MRLFRKKADLQNYVQAKRNQGLTIGFVPTMGALHSGHLKLASQSIAMCDVTVVSIFVNPTQFNNKNDLEKYPRTIESDLEKLSDVDCDAVFLPNLEEIYPPNGTTKYYALGEIETLFEGKYRPGHFQGVCQVIDKLFFIVEPDKVFFGQKDYQQCMIVRKLISQTPDFRHIDMQIVPTEREENGLAKSSRNMLLQDEEKKLAPAIYEALVYIKANMKPGKVNEVLQHTTNALLAKGFKPDYVAIANADTLEPISDWDGSTPVIALIAAFLGNVRLIDNLILNTSS